MFRLGSKFTLGIAFGTLNVRRFAKSDEENSGDDIEQRFSAQRSFQATVNLQKYVNKPENVNFKNLALIGGTGNQELAKEVSGLIGLDLEKVKISRFSDGEVCVRLLQNIRGRDAYIIQPCAAPVNDSIMELLLTISAAKRAGANRVTAVIPYFGYKHHRRGTAISTRHQSRFLSSAAMDFARMLEEMGVDRVITVDLQRPGQGQEACFFDNGVPLEVILTTDFMLDEFVKHTPLSNNVVIVSPNAECVKKARKFQIGLKNGYNKDAKLAAFFHNESGSGPADVTQLEFLPGKAQIAGADVVIVDDMVDSAGTLYEISGRLKDLGAANVYLCASHGLFTADSMELIERGAVKKVFVCNTLPLPPNTCSKIQQVSIASLIAKVVLSEHLQPNMTDEDDAYEMD